MFEKLKGFCDSLLEQGLPGFDLALYKDGNCVLRYMNGYRDLENQIKMNGEERLNIYSASKGFTCTAALQLWEKGLFSLEDKLSDYMPEFKDMTVQTEAGIQKAENPILIRHLFEMSAGFSYNTRSPQLLQGIKDTDGKCPTRETMKYLAKEPLLFEPGTKWQYSLCHDVLAAFVELIAGEKFEDYTQTHLFDVLGMNDTTFMLPENELETIAPQYRFKDGTPTLISKKIDTYKLGSEYASGGAGAISTVNDYVKFVEALRTYALLKPETIDRMTTGAGLAYPHGTHGYGLGVRCPNGKKGYDDFGWGGAAGCFWAISRENAISLFFGAHLLMSPVQGLRRILYRFARAELLDPTDIPDIYDELRTISEYPYHLTY